MKKIMTLFVVCMMCLSLVGCAPAVMGYPMAGQIQNSWPYLTIQSSKMSQKTSTPKLESNSALVTVDGETELFYLANAEFSTDHYSLGSGNNRVKVYRDKFNDVQFYSYDSEGRVDKSLSFRLHTVGGRAEKGKIQTQDDVTKTGEGSRGDVSFTFSTATDVWTEDCSIAMSNMHLMADSLGVGSCWIQGRLREAPDGRTTEEYLRELLQFPDGYKLEAILSLGIANKHPESHSMEDLLMDKIHREKY